ncbi:monofunctional biosynthetic peptidoglycan transglycosylase [Hyphococcus sp. DH-69]|uniref:monofunctional biosynthetic peptidoglycan transglycosylase n=1 Tax=Hyphococcus formosus TaxID=3143534 RepID=UPI00398B7C4B
MALTAPKRKRKTKRRKKKAAKGRVARGLRLAGFALIGLVLGSVLWAGLYRVAPPPGTLLMLQRKMSGDVIIHPWVPLDEISPHLVTAVIAAEDTRFCIHNGIDLEAIDKALLEKKNGKKLRGASTISQQTAKNAFFWNGGGWVRKGGEAWMTVLIETVWPKRRIMEVYLNIAEWGDGHFGAEAAAQARFGKSARDLTRHEAALLASVLPNPHKWRVDPPGPYVRGRAATIRARMNNVRRDGLDHCVLR